jgi:hypothetical protein
LLFNIFLLLNDMHLWMVQFFQLSPLNFFQWLCICLMVFFSSNLDPSQCPCSLQKRQVLLKDNLFFVDGGFWLNMFCFFWVQGCFVLNYCLDPEGWT